MPVIIDGHNLLHSIQQAGEDSEPISRIQLCRILSGYLKLIDENGEIVFDGTGPRDKSGFDNISNLEVFFAGLGSDADTVIEDKIKANTAPRRLTVVSSDRRLRDAARARKATSVKSDVFWNNLRRQLSRKEKFKEPTAKRRGLSESETKQWLEFFGLEQ
ncbi:MAG: NYN domain-containing protein [Planctomycetota bacterium]|jgi:predicted RNA-binding protein with PIN domain